ncbi:MAG: class I SAM-dependent methyltransferase [Proteobacteria bacterium]|nr:class I SAM-dependent methyltransferase [Pseudomonadota bacterium]
MINKTEKQSGGLAEVYRRHNRLERGRGFTVLGEKRGPIFAEWLGTGKKILDLGCRDGSLTKYYLSGNEVLGLDIDDEALSCCVVTPNLQTRCVDLNGDWGVEPGAFDAVVASEVLEHLYHPETVLNKIDEVLRPGGLVIGSVPNAFYFTYRLRYLWGRKAATPLADPTHITQFAYAELVGALRRRFRVVDLKGLSRWPRFTDRFPSLFWFDIMFLARKSGRAE